VDAVQSRYVLRYWCIENPDGKAALNLICSPLMGWWDFRNWAWHGTDARVRYEAEGCEHFIGVAVVQFLLQGLRG
jgi:hypothetical protein